MAAAEPKAVTRPKPRRPRRWMWTLIGLAVVFSPIAVALVLAAQAPRFYVERVQGVDEKRLEELASQFLSRGTRLYNSIIAGNNVWREQFDEESINAWFAYDLKRNHRRALPGSVSEPRIALEAEGMRIGFRCGWGPATSVVQVSLKTWVPRENDLAIELQGAKAGMLPLPTTYVRRILESVAERNGCEVRWKRNGSHLVAIISLPRNRGMVLRRAEVSQGALTLSGQSVAVIGFKPQKATTR